MSEVRRPRRYYLLKRQEARKLELSTDGAWRAKQEAEPGTPLPAGFPHQAALAAAGYTALEDLDGADQDELMAAGLSRRESAAVLAALE